MLLPFLYIDLSAGHGKNLLTSPARELKPTTKKLAVQGHAGCIAILPSIELVDGRQFDLHTDAAKATGFGELALQSDERRAQRHLAGTNRDANL
jgi:hypothetical protein